jgi:peptidoglycan/LPS O-acetylase OafA/YrhL
MNETTAFTGITPCGQSKTDEIRAVSERHTLMDTGMISLNGSYYLDLARVVATNLVLIGHSSTFFGFRTLESTGSLGVTIFFLLSGFLITVAAFKRWGRSGPQFMPFMIDRCARIFVPFVPVLFCVALLNAALDLGAHGQAGVNTGLLALSGNLLLLNDYPLLQAATHAVSIESIYPRAYNTAEQFWTIPIEFWTYVVFAAFVFAFLRKESVHWTAVLILVVALPVFLWNVFAGGAGNLSLLWIVGSVAAYLWITGAALVRRPMITGILLVFFGGLCLAGRVLKVGFNAYEFQQSFLMAAVLFGGFFVANALPIRPIRSGKLVTLLAGYSYSLYLVHNTVLIIFHEKISSSQNIALLAMAAAHVTAYGFYLIFERRYHEVGVWLKKRVSVR